MQTLPTLQAIDVRSLPAPRPSPVIPQGWRRAPRARPLLARGPMIRANRGFTLLEMVTTIAIVAILAALAVPLMRAARGNATVQSTGFELKVRLEGMRARA